MANIDDTIWSLEPHTEMKHTILRKYLNAWIPILTSAGSDLIYIDGFAGPGEYKNKEPGSPFIALDSLKKQVVDIKHKVHFIFIEKEKERCDHLQKILSQYQPTANAIVEEPICGLFDEAVSGVLDKIDSEIERLKKETGKKYQRVPTFAFIDPFGYNMPISIIKRIMSSPKSEVLITLVIPEMKRFCLNTGWEELLNNLYGTSDWKKITEIQDPDDKTNFLRDLYINQLRNYCNINHILYFKMINKNNQIAYFLIFGSNHWRGIEVMKNAMWTVDPTGNYTFSDLSHPGQSTLMDFAGFDYSLIQNELRKLSGKTLTILDIKEYITVNTPYPTNKLKTEVLKPMELRGELIPRSPRKNPNLKSYPNDDFKVEFLLPKQKSIFF